MVLSKRAEHIDRDGRIRRCHDTDSQLSGVARLHTSRNVRRKFSVGENIRASSVNVRPVSVRRTCASCG